MDTWMFNMISRLSMSNDVHFYHQAPYDVTPTSANISVQENAVLKPWKLSIANDWEISD